MRRISILTVSALVAGLVAVALPAAPAAAVTNATLDATTCVLDGGPTGLLLGGTWNTATSTCTLKPDAFSGFGVLTGTTLTIPAGTTLTTTSLQFNVLGSVVNDGTINVACVWADLGVTTNNAGGQFNLPHTATCPGGVSLHRVTQGSQFLNYGVYANDAALRISAAPPGTDGSFTNFCGSTFSATLESGSLAPTPPTSCAQSISFTGPATGLTGGSYTPAATATSGLPVSFSVDATSTGCSLSAGVVHFDGAGSCVIDADQAGDSTFAAAPQVQASTTIAALCLPGFFSPTGATPCTPAPKGSYVDTPGATAATRCPVGFFSAITGANACVAAPVGSYVDADGAVAATACPSGMTTATTGATSASACVPVNEGPSFVLASPVLTASVGTLYGYTFTASGVPAPTYALAAGAPAWLSIDGGSGVLSGTPPTGTTTFTYKVVATNIVGSANAGPFTVTVSAPPASSTKADVSAALSCPTTGRVGTNATCTLTVRNAGPAVAKPVWATLALPPALALVSTSAGGSSWRNIVSWKVASLNANATATFTVTYKPRIPGKALVGAAAVAANPDPNWRNNFALVTTTLTR